VTSGRTTRFIGPTRSQFVVGHRHEAEVVAEGGVEKTDRGAQILSNRDMSRSNTHLRICQQARWLFTE